MGGGVTHLGAIYEGDVVHRRARPKRHRLSYRVFSMLVDLDQLEALDRGLRLFSVDRFNVFSLYRKDFGGHDRKAAPADFIRAKAESLGIADRVHRIRMLAYPRVFGFAFNPLTVYFVEDIEGRTIMLVHEVHNTFGEHHFYQSLVDGDAPTLTHVADKAFYVSPFNSLEGNYRFAIRPPGDEVFLGIVLTTTDGPLLSAHFSARKRPLTDGTLLKLALAYPLLAGKVLAGIHFEALRLWLKGLPLTLYLRRMHGRARMARR